MRKKSQQELFWEKEFGNKYTTRNLKYSNKLVTVGKHLLTNNVLIDSALELGANVGYNLDAIKKTYPHTKTYGVEINKKASAIGRKKHIYYNKSIYDFNNKKKYDLVFCSGVLIHQNPKYLNSFYKKLYTLSKKYIYISEYFNVSPTTVDYRGHSDKLYKRDFAKELWKKYPRLELVDYGFNWEEDPALFKTVDSTNWFLFKKK